MLLIQRIIDQCRPDFQTSLTQDRAPGAKLVNAPVSWLHRLVFLGVCKMLRVELEEHIFICDTRLFSVLPLRTNIGLPGLTWCHAGMLACHEPTLVSVHK